MQAILDDDCTLLCCLQSQPGQLMLLMVKTPASSCSRTWITFNSSRSHCLLAGVSKGKGPPSAPRLQLTVGSQMETGEWKANGWVEKNKAAEDKVPSNLQVIAADDLVKVSNLGSSRACSGCDAAVLMATQHHRQVLGEV